MKNFTIAFLLCTSLVLTGCDGAKQVIDTTSNIQLSGAYTVTSVYTKNVEKNTTPTITFNALDKTVNGQTGCNSFFGTYTLNLYNLNFGEFGVSEKHCEEPIMEQERQFLDALRQTGSFTYRNGVLTLFSALDKSVLLQARKDGTETN